MPVTGGTLNGPAASSCEARKVGAETMLARIVAMVAEAQRSRAPIQGLADAVAAWFVPAVVAGRRDRVRRLAASGPDRRRSPTRWSRPSRC